MNTKWPIRHKVGSLMKKIFGFPFYNVLFFSISTSFDGKYIKNKELLSKQIGNKWVDVTLTD